MKIKKSRFDFSITHEDLLHIKAAVQLWGKPTEVINDYSGSLLHCHYEMWEDFVTTDWQNWDIAEYQHDIGCRTWIQIAIEHSCKQTSEHLLKVVKPIDMTFIEKMIPSNSHYPHIKVLGNQPYFWESNTIYID